MDYNAPYVVAVSLDCMHLIHGIVVEHSQQHVILEGGGGGGGKGKEGKRNDWWMHLQTCTSRQVQLQRTNCTCTCIYMYVYSIIIKSSIYICIYTYQTSLST